MKLLLLEEEPSPEAKVTAPHMLPSKIDNLSPKAWGFESSGAVNFLFQMPNTSAEG